MRGSAIGMDEVNDASVSALNTRMPFDLQPDSTGMPLTRSRGGSKGR